MGISIRSNIQSKEKTNSNNKRQTYKRQQDGRPWEAKSALGQRNEEGGVVVVSNKELMELKKICLHTGPVFKLISLFIISKLNLCKSIFGG